MANRVGKHPAGAIISIITSRLKEYTKKSVPPELWYDIINGKVDMIHEVLSIKDKAIYKDKAVLADTSNEGAIATNTSTNVTYNNTTKILTDTAGGTGFKYKYSGSISDFTGFKGGDKVTLIIADAQSKITSFLMDEVDEVISAVQLKLKHGVFPAVSSLDANDYIIIHPSASTSEEISIGSAAYYKMIDQILTVFDSSLNDECINAETLSNFYSMRKTQLGADRSYRNSIIYVRDGETLLFAKGANITSYGTRTMHYTRKPYSITSDADIVDLPASNTDLLYSLCMLAGLQTIQVPIPNELKSAENQINAMQQAKEREIVELMKNSTDN